MKRVWATALFLAAITASITACEDRREGPGERIDEAGEDVGRSVEDATD